jgi:hypothetical protein
MELVPADLTAYWNTDSATRSIMVAMAEPIS